MAKEDYEGRKKASIIKRSPIIILASTLRNEKNKSKLNSK